MKQLKTKRLSIVPMTDDELTKQIGTETDEHMQSALKQMAALCAKHPKDRLWCTNWRIFFRDSGEGIGSLGFKGPPKNGGVEIGYGIDTPHRERGYAFEAVKALVNWALSQDGVYFVTAETAYENTASIRVLEKLSFKRIGMGAEGLRYEKEKQPSAWMSTYMCLGMSIGIALGSASGNLAVGLSVGMCIGIAAGSAMDARDKKIRTKLRAARNGTEQ